MGYLKSRLARRSAEIFFALARVAAPGCAKPYRCHVDRADRIRSPDVGWRDRITSPKVPEERRKKDGASPIRGAECSKEERTRRGSRDRVERAGWLLDRCGEGRRWPVLIGRLDLTGRRIGVRGCWNPGRRKEDGAGRVIKGRQLRADGIIEIEIDIAARAGRSCFVERDLIVLEWAC
jgi:hypothetical protein